MRTLIYDYKNINNALLMNIYNDNSKYKVDWKMELIQEYVRIN